MDEQFQLVNTIETDMGPAREQLDAIQGVGVELQRLVAEQSATALAREATELAKRFNNVADAVSTWEYKKLLNYDKKNQFSFIHYFLRL